MRNLRKKLTLCICFFLLLGLGVVAQRQESDLSDLVLVLDPGHGDRSCGQILADPGAVVQSDSGPISECVLTWDTALRLKQLVEQRGGKVFLTLENSNEDKPSDWPPNSIPKPGTSDFSYRALVSNPNPRSEWETLQARVDEANSVFRTWSWTHDVYFISLHFDSTSPDLAGISFYYPTWCKEPGFRRVLEDTIRKSHRARQDLRTGQERGLSQPGRYAILSHSENYDAYLVELANLRSEDSQGGNPDLWRARSAEGRQAYAELLLEALVNRPEPSPDSWKFRQRASLKKVCLLAFVLLSLVIWRLRRSRRQAS